MPRTVPPAFLDQLTARVNDDPCVLAIEITHEDLSIPIRVAKSPVDVVSNGETFFGVAGIEITMPGETEETARGSVTIQNVDQRVGRAVKQIKGEVGCRLIAWLESDPDALLFDFSFFTLRNFQVNNLTVSAEAWAHDVAGEPCPARRATPEATPGLWVA